MPATSLDTLKSGLAEFSDATTTLYFPKPIVQVGGEKWRILQKNILDALEASAPDAKKTYAFVKGLELEDFNGLGFAVFEDAGNFKTTHLNTRPVAMLHTKDAPFALPLMRDLGSRKTAWILTLDKEEPGLYLYSGGDLIDHSSRLRTEDGNNDEPVEMDTILARREIQDDVFFHAGSRGRTRNAQARSTYHALGASHDEERDNTLTAYYALVIDALQYGLPYQVEELYVMGTEKVVGRFCAMIQKDLGEDFVLHQVHQGDDDEQTIIDTIEPLLTSAPDMPEVETVDDPAAILAACREGRVGELYIVDDLTDGLDTTTDADSERVKVLVVGEGYGEPLADALPFNAIATAALDQGAQLHFIPNAYSGTPLKAVMRWEKAGDPEGVSPEEDIAIMDEAARRQAENGNLQAAE